MRGRIQQPGFAGVHFVTGIQLGARLTRVACELIVASGGGATARRMAGRRRRRHSLAALEGARAHLRRRGRQVQQGSEWDGGGDEGEAGGGGGDEGEAFNGGDDEREAGMVAGFVCVAESGHFNN